MKVKKAPSGALSAKRMRRQGWLLLGFWLLLAAALGQWLLSAFRSAAQQLNQSIVNIWQSAQLQSVDAYRVATKVFTIPSDSILSIEDSLLMPLSNIRTITIENRKGGAVSTGQKPVSHSSVEIHEKRVQLCSPNGIPKTCRKTDGMQATDCEGEGSVPYVHDRSLFTKATPRIAVSQRSPVGSMRASKGVARGDDSADSLKVFLTQTEGMNTIVIDHGAPSTRSKQLIISAVDPNVASSIDTAKLRREFTKLIQGRKLRVHWRVIGVSELAADSAQLWVDAGDGRFLVASVDNRLVALAWGMLPAVLGVVFVLLLAGGTLRAFYKSQRGLYRLMLFQRDFARNMAHEMRTPLATLRLLLESLSRNDDSRSEKKQTQYLSLASQETDRLITLAERLSAAARTGDANLQLRVERIDLMDLLRASIALFQPAAAQANATISLSDVECGVLFVEMDGIYLRSVVDNLIDNAIKYGGRGVQLAIAAEQRLDSTVVRFADNGPGIAPEHAARVFERFYRVPTGDRLPVRGLGVGLFFCREAMRAHGGDIALQSEPGRGCCFTITIPSQHGA